VELTEEEEQALKGEKGETLQLAYRILVAIGEATDAKRLVPVSWAHLSGVNYNTIGDAGEEFLSKLSQSAKVKIKTTLNPMGFDSDSISKYSLDENFIKKQHNIKQSYEKMGVIPSFSCIPYEIFDLPEKGTQVSFAESNAAIYVNSISNLRTNKESAFSALASALTGKSPYSDLRINDEPDLTIRMKIEKPSELTMGLLGYFAGKVAGNSVRIAGISQLDKRSCKSLCAGLGTSGTCGKFLLNEKKDSEQIDFDKLEMKKIFDELNTTEKGNIIALGSPQLGFEEISELALSLKGKSFRKRCLIFCPRLVKEQARKVGYLSELERAGCEVLSDCCTCLSPLIDKNEVDSVTTNSVKGAYYLKNSNHVQVNLKPLSQIIYDETK